MPRCISCERPFPTVEKLEHHLLVPESELTCSKCHQVFFCPTIFNLHFRYCAKDVRRHSCHTCSKYFVCGRLYNQHLKQFDQVCSICHMTFKCREKYKAHLRSHDPNSSRVSCRKCRNTFEDLNDFYDHKDRTMGVLPLEMNGGDHTCYVCGLGYRSECNLLNRFNEVHGRVACKACGFRTFSERCLDFHSCEKVYGCQRCHQRFVTEEEVLQHVAVCVKRKRALTRRRMPRLEKGAINPMKKTKVKKYAKLMKV